MPYLSRSRLTALLKVVAENSPLTPLSIEKKSVSTPYISLRAEVSSM